LLYAMPRHMFPKRQNQWGGPTKSHATLVPFAIFWSNVAVTCKNELPLSMRNFIPKH
jgi:hypothetical protein